MWMTKWQIFKYSEDFEKFQLKFKDKIESGKLFIKTTTPMLLDSFVEKSPSFQSSIYKNGLFVIYEEDNSEDEL